MHGTLRNKKVLLLGVAFKAHTGDVRESPALNVVKFLVEEKARVHVFDPVVDAATITKEFPSVVVENQILAGAEAATAIVVCTEWPQFREADWEAIFRLMQRPAAVFDGRLCLDKTMLESIGFELHRIGCSSMKAAQK
jgi:UDPglucose 6-dehydrogenase